MTTEIVEAMTRDGLTRQQAERVVRGFQHDVVRGGETIATWVRQGKFIVRENRTYGIGLSTRNYYDADAGWLLPF